MSIPTDFSAIESNDFSYLFYARSNGTIASLKSNTTHEGNDTVYNSSSVLVSGNVVNASSPRLSAVAYKLNGKREIRVYYIAPKSNGKQFQLRELCQTDGGEWCDGALNKNNIIVAEKSLLSANVEFEKGDLKVFFLDPENVPGVTWVGLGQTAWAQHLLDDPQPKW